MKKLILRTLALAGSSLCFTNSAFASLSETQINLVTGLSAGTDLHTSIVDIIQKVLDYVLLLGVVFIIYAGIRLITSGGDEGAKDKAKQTVIYVVIGIIVVLLAKVIVSFVNTIFG